MKLKGTIQISRAVGREEDKPIHISIDDDTSHCRILDIWMALDEFARAITSSQGEAEINYFPKAPIGMRSEHKEENVLGDYSDDPAMAVKPHEVDGWKARDGDFGNGHRRTENGYRVVFFRHVNPETGEPV